MIKRSTVLIAGDHLMFRETWSYILQRDERFKVVAQCDFGHDLEKALILYSPSIVILDINLPGNNSLEWIQSVVKRTPASKVIVISVVTQPSFTRKLLHAGVMAYLTKNSSSSEIYDAITEIQQNRKYICKEVKNILSEQMMTTDQDDPQAVLEKLSAREREVIGHIVQGLSSKEIALYMNVAVKTVEVHRYNILRKSGMRNVAALVNFINSSQLLVTC
jgi:two-component system invasion response regulator UvrY